jgi:amino acid adenylation domain-containing protein
MTDTSRDRAREPAAADRPAAAPRLLHETFEAQAARTPAAAAVVAGERRLSYAELETRANRLAHHLRRLGVGPEVPVGLCLARGEQLVVGLLGVLKAGGAYVPLDPAYPESRLALLLADSQVPVLVTEQALLRTLPSLPAHPVRRVVLDADAREIAAASGERPANLALPANLAYVIYTSGSTGRPKGVAITHRSATARVSWALRSFSRQELAGVLAATSICFDLSVFELFVPLAAGGAAILAANALALPALPAAAEVTLINTVPGAMAELVRQGGVPPSVLVINLAGEALPGALVAAIHRTTAAARVLNLYGPSEDTTYSTCAELGRGPLPAAPWPPIGRPLPGTRAVLLAARGGLAAVTSGTSGADGLDGMDAVDAVDGADGTAEIYLGGEGLARGYLGRPDLTAERFLPDPSCGRLAAAGSRLYRTGDLARRLPGGDLLFLGRTDQQVKIRGFRVELGEIEAALARHPAVREAAAAAREDEQGGRLLVAYLAADPVPTARELREFLRRTLPEHMVPSIFVHLDALPRTPNGKLDRRSLPAPGAAAADLAEPFVAPRSPLERRLAALWSELLGLSRIGIDDDFFALGGHSLTATRMLARLRDGCGVELTLATLFAAPTVAALAATIAAATTTTATAAAAIAGVGGVAGEAAAQAATPPAVAAGQLVAAPDQARYPLSPAQLGVWFADRLALDQPAYHVASAVGLRGPLDPAALAAALAAVAARHEPLRTRFPEIDGEPWQEILEPEAASARLPLWDLSSLPQAARPGELERLTLLAARLRFSLARGRLLHAVLVRLAPGGQEHALLVTVHHLVFDGWSEGIFWRELSALYDAALGRRPCPLPAPRRRYADYAWWQRLRLDDPAIAGQAGWWRERLADCPPLDLPTDQPRPPLRTWHGGLAAWTLPPPLADRLRELARRRRATPFMALAAAYAAVLSRSSRQLDFAIGVPTAGRRSAELEGLIGLFVNEVCLRADLAGDPSFDALLGRVRETALAALDHQDLPFDRLVAELNSPRDASRGPLFQATLQVVEEARPLPRLPGVEATALDVHTGTAKVDLELELEDAGVGPIAGRCEYARDLFDRPTVERLLGRLGRLIAAALAEPDRPVAELPWLDAQERRQLRDWSQGPLAAGTVPCVHELVWRQAAARPAAVAVEGPGASLSYGELARRAHRLARRLAAEGVGPETVVGIACEPSPTLVVTLLAVLEAGGAFLPLDPALPEERRSFMLRDAGAALVIGDPHLFAGLPAALGAPRALGEEGLHAAGGGRPAATAAPLPDQLAYVLYTSGTSGRPKGVAVPHRALANRMLRAREAFGLGPDDALPQLAALGFDVALSEIFLPLVAGGRTVLPGAARRRDPRALASLCAEYRITFAELVPPVVELLLEEGALQRAAASGLRQLVVGGEVLPRALYDRFAAAAGIPIHNAYGPTEAAIDATWRTWRPSADGEDGGDGESGEVGGGRRALTVPIGRPIGGCRVHVLEPGGAPAPLGVPGELVVGGACLARGYVGQPAATAEGFVPDPFAAAPGERLYRTGDRCRWLAGGELEFLGRDDQQVKVRGVRVEPAEVEAVLLRSPAVAAAAVIARQAMAGTSLVACVVPAAGAPPAAGELRAFLAATLPEPMVPQEIVFLAALPLTANGKLDRRALAAATIENELPRVRRTPLHTLVERVVAGIFAEVLDREQDGIGGDDDFFDLGGHSLLAVKVLSRLRSALGVELEMRHVFTAPTVSALAAWVEKALAAEHPADGEASAAGPAPKPGPAAVPALPPLARTPRMPATAATDRAAATLPTSYAQQRLWFLDRLAPGRATYNVAAAYRLAGEPSPAALAAALGAVVRRHETLRTRFVAVQGEPRQMILPPMPVPLPLVDLRALPAAASELARLRREEGARPFDLGGERRLLLRAALVRLAAGEQVLLATIHHIAFDAWSEEILRRELTELYLAAASGRPAALPEPALQYADFAAWQRGWPPEAMARRLAFWSRQLAGAPVVLELPTDRPRPAAQSFRGAIRELLLPAEAARLQRAARREGATLHMLSSAVFAALLARYTGQRDLLIGTPVANRARPEVQGLIGFFVNLLPLRVTFAGEPDLRRLLAAVRDTALAAYAHEDLPFEALVEALRPERDPSRNPLVQVVLGFEPASRAGAAPAGPLGLEPLPTAETATAKCDLSLVVHEGQGAAPDLALELEYATDLFTGATAARLLAHFAALLAGAAAAPETPLADLPLLGPAERQQLLEWNDRPGVPRLATGGAAADRPGARRPAASAVRAAGSAATVPERVWEQAWRAPDRPAVVNGGHRLGYGELVTRAGRLARTLRAAGVGPEVRVGVCLERSPELVAAQLAVLTAGGAYVALDPSHPEERLSFELADSAASVLLARRGPVAELAAARGIRCLFPHELDLEGPAREGDCGWAEAGAAGPAAALSPDNLAYVIYTSGSTGRPKGVEISHRSLAGLVDWHVEAFAVTADDRATLLSAVGFDAAVWETWPYLASGASLHLPPEALRFSAAGLRDWLLDERITIGWLPVALAEELLDLGWPSARPALRCLLTGGDRLRRHPHPSLPFPLVNNYGPTEGTVVTTSGAVPPGAERERRGQPPTIGRPITGVRVSILDAALRPVPAGVPGELAVGGRGLARGYLRRPDLTAERFVPDPTGGAAAEPGERLDDPNGAPGARLYRTGDLARFLPDGEIEFLGRLDHQVKIRGLRIELGEIEAVLAGHAGVRDAAVVARDGRLVAYWTARPATATPSLPVTAALPATPTASELREHLRRQLPDYMVPADFVALEAMPLNASGKVDRRALPAPAPAAALARGSGEPERVEPASQLEELIAGIWEEVLGRPANGSRAVGVHDNFFALGGHSLMVTRVLSRVREALGVALPVHALFEHPTVATLAQRVAAVRQESEEITLPPLGRGPRARLAPLSFPQQRLWFLDRLTPGSATYNIPTAWELRGPLDPAALAAGLSEIVRRHEVLRTRFVEVAGEPWQEVLPAAPVPLPLVDLARLPDRSGERAAELARLGREQAALPFDLAGGPLLRARLVRLAARAGTGAAARVGAGSRHALLLTVHHIVSDGWSESVLLHELSLLYAAARGRGHSPLAEPPVQYADFAAWQRAWPPAVLERQLAYWREQLAGLATLAVPTDHPRPPVQSFRGGGAAFTVPAGLAGGLRALARARRVTLFMTTLAAWQALLHRLTGQADVAVGSPLANRGRPEIEDLIGFFVNILPLRTDCGGGPGFAELLDRVRRTALAAYDHADLPFERLVDELGLARDLSRQALVQVMFALDGPAPAPALSGLEVTPLDPGAAIAKFDLTLYLVDRGEVLTGWIEYSADLFDRATVFRLAGRFVNLLAGGAADAGAPLAGLDLLAAAERHQLLREWNDTAAPFPEGTLLHDFFAAAAARAPRALAASCAGEDLTYAELAARANRLGHLLRAGSGVGLPRGAGVGVWMERSLDMLAAVLGILEAGGHYLPLDASWPAERVESILAATGARALVAGRAQLAAAEEMRWRLPALADTLCLAVDAPELPVEEVDPESVRALWDYVAERAVDRVTAGGFVSAITGRPFGEAEVDEYRDRVLALAAPWLRRDARVLEIGCGAGLLLWEIAPRVGRCVGLDPSPLTQQRNRERRDAAGLDRVELLTGFAHELDGLVADRERFDLVLIASTAQFFPGPRYLERVIRDAAARLAPGGALVVADVLDARRRGELAHAIATGRRTSGAAGAAGAAGGVDGAAPPRGRELYLDEDFFADLGEAAIHHRDRGFANELRYRYDVVLLPPRPRCPDVAPARRRKRWWTSWHTARQPASRLPAVAGPEDVAYVIHTSGSTGEPKGIVVQHRPVANLIAWINRALGIGARDRLLFVASLSFDLSVYDVFGVLAAGGAVQVATDAELADPDRLVGLLRQGAVTIWDSAPAALVRLAPLFPAAPEPASALRLVLLSGDWIPVTLPERVRRAFPAARVIALGGATEATVWSNWFPVAEVDPGWPSIPYGRPIANARYHVLEALADGLGPCTIGVPGDLYIGGDCLASGYAGRPELTAPSFLPDPFSRRPGARLYRTGDRARHLPDGNLEFLGRLDHQVKVRGYRIELGEIEVALARHPGVREAVVMARAAGAADTPAGSAGSAGSAAGAAAPAAAERMLVAYVVPAGGERAAPAPEELRDHLRRALPEYMVPAAFVFLPALPVTANGKLDRAALPAPAAAGGAPGEDGSPASPRNAVEHGLAGLWSEVLGVSRIGIHDNFFTLGGHSLLATQLVARIRQSFGVELPLRTLFQRPTVAELAAAMAAMVELAGGQASPIRPVGRGGELPLSSSQLRQWFLVELEPGTPAYDLSLALRLAGPLVPAALAGALAEIVRRHETLRTTFTASEGRPVAVIAAAPAPPPLPLVDLHALPAGARHAACVRLARAESERVFDLQRGPLLVAALLRLDAGEHLLLLTIHHIVFDGWSLAVFTRELAALYLACRDGRPSPLPPLAVQYVDYAAWQQRWLEGDDARRQLEYWRARLAGAAKMLHLPADRPRPAVQSYRGAAEPVRLPASLVRPLRELGRAQGATLFMTLLAGFYALLGRYTRQADLNVGTYVANRRWQDVEPLLGFFVNTLVLRTELGGEASFRELLGRVRETTLGAFEHQDLPFEKLLEELAPERDLSRTPLFQAMFGLQNFAAGAVEAPGLAITPVDLYEGVRANCDLALWLSEEGDALTGVVHFSADLFERATIRRLAGHLAGLLAALVAAPERRLAEASWLTPAERHQAAIEWSAERHQAAIEWTATAAGAPAADGAPRAAHQLVWERAERSPAAPAVIQGNEVLTYGELAARARAVAGCLRRLGIGPESVVALCCPRCPEMVAAVLGILEAGAAYLPLDPALPAERLAFLLADARAAALLAPRQLVGVAGLTGVPVVRLEETAAAVGVPAGRRGMAGVPDLRQLAYVLYTSGSTGRPKGVQVEHGALARFTLAALAAYGLRPDDRVLQFASLSFDASVEEIFPCLAAGAALVLRDDEMMASPARFLAACGEWRITVLDLPTAYWHTLAAELARERLVCPPSLRLVILGGEAALPERVLAWLAATGPSPCLVNTYGPTEATVVATACWLPPPAGGGVSRPGASRPGVALPAATIAAGAGGAALAASAPIGRPWGDAQVWLLDAALQPVPVGVAGELHVAGGSLARGYLGRPELTAERFVPAPDGLGAGGVGAPGAHLGDRNGAPGARRGDRNGAPGARLYRTGDLARYRPDGCLEFVGRVDDQVKIRGFRVEPGEVAALLAAHPAVREAAVVAAEDERGGRRLLAYVVPADAGPETAVGELRDFLKARLPAYMVPSDFVTLAALPLTPTGKLDRAALPPPAAADPADGYAPPETGVEQTLVEIWRQVLRRDRIGIHDNLFDLGGHSLLLPQLLARIVEAFELAMPLRVLFEAPTVAQLAVAIERELLAQIEGLSDEEAASLIAGVEMAGDAVAGVSTSDNA